MITIATLELSMRLWTKLTLGFAVTALLIVALYGANQLRNEAVDLRGAAERDLRLVGTTVQVGVQNAFRDKQTADVQEIIDVVKLRDPSLDVLVFDASGSLTAGSWGSTAVQPLVRGLTDRARANDRAVLQFEGPRGLSHLIGAFPLHTDDDTDFGTLVVVRPLDELRRDLDAETQGTVLSLVTLVIALAGAGWLLSSRYVRRPLLDLVQTMRAVRAGDLSAKVSFKRADEMGEAVSEFNAMVAELGDARRRLIAETEAREALEIALQRTDKLITVGQLSAGLAHEIGSPLQVVNGRARALAARPDIPADIRRIAEIVANESDRIARIVEQLLTFARHTTPKRIDVGLREPVRDVVALFELEARRHAVRLEFVYDESLPLVNADAGQVQQVVMNLLRNAVRATPRGGHIHVSLTTQSPTGGQSEPSVCLAVEDSGEGIPDDVAAHMFEPFFTTRSHSGGTGLGLAIVKSIVDAHRGTITVTPRDGGGTRFALHFPLAGAEALAGGRVA
jgi:two-component system, NtrC family, sensor histidine kinase HydH